MKCRCCGSWGPWGNPRHWPGLGTLVDCLAVVQERTCGQSQLRQVALVEPGGLVVWRGDSFEAAQDWRARLANGVWPEAATWTMQACEPAMQGCKVGAGGAP